MYVRPSQVAPVVKNPPANAGDIKDRLLIPKLKRSPWGGHGDPLQYFCLENPMDRGAWQTTVHGVARVRHDWVHTRARTHTHTRWSDQFGFFKEFFKIFYVPVVLLCFKLAMILLLKYIYFSTFHEIWCRIWNTCKCSIRRLTQSGSLNSQAILFPLFRWFGIELEVCQTWNIFCCTKFIHLYLILVHAWELSHSAVVWLFGTP